MAGIRSTAKVLLTGATGFLGRHCLDSLIRDRVEVHAVNRTGVGPHAADVAWHATDLLDPGANAALIARIQPTHLLHNAWIASPGRFWTDPENLKWLEAGVTLLRAFRDHGGERFVGTGSCAEYDWSAERYIEDETKILPATLYGRSKVAMWAAAKTFASDDMMSAAWVRIFLVYGPGDSKKRLIPSVMQALQAARPIDLGSGTQVRDFVWAPDVADLLVQLLSCRDVGVFNAGTGIGTSVREATEFIANRLGRSELLRFGVRPDPVSEPESLVADMRKTQQLVQWAPRTNLSLGLETLLQSE